MRISGQFKYFNLVVVDGRFPFADPLARGFSNIIDDVIIVAEAGVSREDDLQQMLRTLSASKMNVRGAVLVGGSNHGLASVVRFRPRQRHSAQASRAIGRLPAWRHRFGRRPFSASRKMAHSFKGVSRSTT